MAHIPYISGYSPVRWQKGIDVMLERKIGNFRVDKLRDSPLMYTAEQLQVVAKEQYWSRKHKAAIEQCLNKRLTFDLARQLKRPLAMCSNDAKSCNDRTAHYVASLCMRRMGVEEPLIVCMFRTIQNLQHSIFTVYGDFELTFIGELPGQFLSKVLAKETVPARKFGQFSILLSSICYGIKAMGHTFGQLSLVLRSAL
jgi:hypothetical protein